MTVYDILGADTKLGGACTSRPWEIHSTLKVFTTFVIDGATVFLTIIAAKETGKYICVIYLVSNSATDIRLEHDFTWIIGYIKNKQWINWAIKRRVCTVFRKLN